MAMCNAGAVTKPVLPKPEHEPEHEPDPKPYARSPLSVPEGDGGGARVIGGAGGDSDAP